MQKQTSKIISKGLVVIWGMISPCLLIADTDSHQTTLTVGVQGTISLDCGADVDLGSLTPGTPVGGSSTCTVTTSSGGGYELSLKRDDIDTTLDLTGEASTNITDKTDWDKDANSGSGNTDTYSGTGLGFSLFDSTANKNITWWGSGTTYNDVNNKYAGIPNDYEVIMDYDDYSASSTVNEISYRLDVPATQKSGVYNGTITYQAVDTP